MAYVVEHSNRTLPLFFKFAAIWSGQQGSLLFWSLLLSIYVFSVLFTYRGKHPELMPYVGVVLVSVQLFSLILNNFIASPFQVLGAAGPTGALQWIARADGNGLNPLLQYTEMVIHPPMLSPPDPQKSDVLMDSVAVSLAKGFGADLRLFEGTAVSGIERHRVCRRLAGG
jgi:cytochrome c-type biogenesis protein CcmF